MGHPGNADPSSCELAAPIGAPELCGIDRERLRQSVYRRVFGACEPVKIGRFTVLERIGRGGMGVVYKAYDTRLDRKVAVKVIHTGGASEAARHTLAKEAQALARLSHPNVVHVYEVGEGHDGELFLAMEFVDGPTLREWLARAPRTWPEIVDVCTQAIEGLAAAHAAGLVHRDFKPDNVIVGADGRARVLDFGLARSEAAELATRPDAIAGDELRTRELSTLDGARGLVGTPAYMAPEQIAEGAVGIATDQFSCCATLFEALYGVRPFAGTTLTQLHVAIERGVLAVPERRCGVPKRVHRAIVQGLSAQPGRRHASLQVLLGELRSARRGQRLRAVGVVALLGLTAVSLAGAYAATRTPVSADDPLQQGELVMLRAEALLDTDPSAAVAALAELPADSPHWSARAFALAEQAELRGIADRELTIDDGLEPLLLGGEYLLAHRPATRSLVRIDIDGAELELLADLERPSPHGFAMFGAPRLEVSADGRWAAIQLAERSLAIELSSARRVQLPAAEQLAFSGDGERVAVHGDGRISVIALATGIVLHELSSPSGHGLTLVLDHEGATLGVNVDGAVSVHELDDGSVRPLPTAHADDMAFAGVHGLVTTSVAGGMSLWPRGGGPPRALGASSLRHVHFAVLGDGGWIASEVGDRAIELRELATDRVRELEVGGTPQVSPDGRHLAWLQEDGTVHVLELDSRGERSLAAGTAIRAFAFDGGGGLRTLATDRSLRRWQLPDDPPALRSPAEAFGALAFAPDSAVLFTSERGGGLQRWDARRGTREPFARTDGEVTRLQVSPDGAWLASRSSGGTVEVRDTSDGTLLVATEPSQVGMAFGNDGLYVGDGATISRLDPRTGERVVVLRGSTRCYELAIAPEGDRLVASCGAHIGTGALRAWDLPSGLQTHEIPLERWSALELLDRDHAIGGIATQPLVSLDLRDGSHGPLGLGPRWHGLARTSDASTVVVATMDARIELHHPPSVRAPTLPLDPGEHGMRVAISGDGSLLAHTFDRHTIAVRERAVPRDAEDLRAWVLQHRLARVRMR
ncbi:MAG: protein kinase [Deltaproteobacteria bacterium]|nr:protein kinase [Nannocystaceae bacterium]